jgi:hypothetical protein
LLGGRARNALGRAGAIHGWRFLPRHDADFYAWKPWELFPFLHGKLLRDAGKTSSTFFAEFPGYSWIIP